MSAIVVLVHTCRCKRGTGCDPIASPRLPGKKQIVFDSSSTGLTLITSHSGVMALVRTHLTPCLAHAHCSFWGGGFPRLGERVTEIRRNWGESSIRQSILDPDVNGRPCKIEPTRKNPGLGRGLARSRFSNPLGLPLPANHYQGTRVQFHLAPKIGWTCPLRGCTSSRDTHEHYRYSTATSPSSFPASLLTLPSTSHRLYFGRSRSRRSFGRHVTTRNHILPRCRVRAPPKLNRK
jgi:hypothetical protein